VTDEARELRRRRRAERAIRALGECEIVLDNVYVNVYITGMEKTFEQMTKEERIEALRQRLNDWASKPQTVSFGKAPKDGWKDSDRVAR
jgi:hypothetical protein